MEAGFGVSNSVGREDGPSEGLAESIKFGPVLGVLAGLFEWFELGLCEGFMRVVAVYLKLGFDEGLAKGFTEGLTEGFTKGFDGTFVDNVELGLALGLFLLDVGDAEVFVIG